MDLDMQCEDLSEEQWTELQPRIQQASVLRLDDCGISEEQCRDVSAALRTNLTLRELCLNNNEVGDGGAGHLLQGLQGPACRVQKLSLQNCALTADSCKGLAGLLRSLPTLLELQLSDNSLGDEGLRLLCEGLRDPQCHLERLQLEYCNLGETGCQLLAGALGAKSGLRELALSNNSLGPAGVQALCRGLLGAAGPLGTLKLANCGLTAANCKELSTLLAAKETLQELDLGENKLGDEGVALLCSGLLSPSCRLRILWIWECGLSAQSCEELSRVLRAKESLNALSLAGNALGDPGAKLLCEALREPGCQLESLWVKACDLTEACCADLSAMLAENTHLRELQLSGNRLGDKGVQRLCQGLGQPGSSLSFLWLGDCEVTDDGCASLASLLHANRSLRELDLSNNCMGDPGVRQLMESIRRPDCALEQLVLYDVYVTEAVDNDLKALEESKPSLRIIS